MNSTTPGPTDREVAAFIKKMVAALSAFLIAVSVLTILAPWMPWTIKGRQDRLERIVVRMATVVELGAVVNAEPVGSSEAKAARAELRRLRSVKLDLKEP